MDAIILAAGKGTRLRPHTNDTPKPLLPVQGRPILDWIIGALPPVDRLVVVVNYLAEQIEGYLDQQSHVRNWTTVRQAEPRGTGDALMACNGAITSAGESKWFRIGWLLASAWKWIRVVCVLSESSRSCST